jgi:GNAT superfamily N-acetyltransferase
MPFGPSSGEREYATLVAQLRALEEDVQSARAAARAVEHQHFDLDHETPPPKPHGDHVTLADGTDIIIRPVEPNDKAELAAGFRHLGALTRYRSLGETEQSLTSSQLAELTDVDHDSRETLVALVARTGEAIGIARYVRRRDEPDLADLGCTVADTWQRRGVASALIERLASQARAAGITRFAARTVVGDDSGRRLLAHVADQITEHRDGGTVELTGRPKPS